MRFFKVYQFSLMGYEGKLFYVIMLLRSKGYVFDVVFLVFIDFYKQAMINRHYTQKSTSRFRKSLSSAFGIVH